MLPEYLPATVYDMQAQIVLKNSHFPVTITL